MEKQYIKTSTIGSGYLRTIIKTRKEIVITREGRTIHNPSEELILSSGWKVYTKPEPTYEELLNKEKDAKIREIKTYDLSNDVNEFTISGTPIWLDKATRTGLMLRFQSEMAMGETETTLWYNGQQFPLSLENAMQILYALEVYASKCYDNTEKHISEVKNLENIEEVKAFNIKEGYPSKLIF